MHPTCPRRRFSSRRPRWLVLSVLIITLVLLVSPVAVSAHPLGNFTVNRYSRLVLGAEQVHLHYVLDMAEIPAFQERAWIDADRDGSISDDEQAQYLARELATLQSNLSLRIDGMPLRLESQAQHLEFPPGQGGLNTLRLSADFVATLPKERPAWQGEYRDDNYSGRLGWQEIVVQARSDALLLESTAPAQDVSQELRQYPQDLLQSPLRISSASFRFRPGVATAGSTVAAGASQSLQARAQDRFASLIATPTLAPGTVLLALLAACILGAMHALTPGHGKTIVAAYLVGSRGTARHAAFLGLTTTITHTAGVFILGLVTLFLSHFLLPEQLYPWLGVVSGALVCAIGLSLLSARLRRLIRHNDRDHSHDHHHSHDHGHSHNHDHGDAHDHSQSHLPPGADGTPLNWRSLLALGISGGLLPCPSALVVLLSAIALQRVGFGLLLIVAFSFGLASVLTAIGILLVHAGRLVERVPARGRLLQTVPVGSALVITIAGIGITVRALIETGLL